MGRRINATQMGIMGAITGALQFYLSESTRLRMEQAEMAKLERLRAIEDERWAQRNAIESAQQAERDDLNFRRQRLLNDDQRAWQSGEKAADRQHDYTIENVRTGARLTEIGAQGAETRKNEEYREKLLRTRPPEMQRPGADPTAGKGILGSDGRTYKYGEALPAGVKPTGGYGISWAPSESKSAAAGGRLGGRPAPGAFVAPSRPAVPAGYVQVGTKDGKAVYRAPNGQMFIED